MLSPRLPASSFAVAAVLALALAACTDADPVGAGDTIAPQVGVDGSGDVADADCRVVLRSIARVSDGAGGFATEGVSWIWEGVIDVDAEAIGAGAVAAVAYQSGSDAAFREAAADLPAATDIDGAPPGMRRLRFRIAEGLPGPGMSGSSLARARIQLLPFLHLGDGGRLFDHNAHAAPLANYLLIADDGWRLTTHFTCPVASDGLPHAATLRFASGFAESQERAIVAGGALRVDYALDRLTACRGTHNGFPAWDLRVHARFSPGGEQLDASVRAFEAVNGIPTTTAFAVPARFAVPDGATAVEIWARNSGIACEGYDSDDSANYRFAVEAPPAWIGAAEARLSRDTSDPCAGAPLTAEPSFHYDTWVRQRAAMRNVCFRVWSPGVTDRADGELWRRLDATAYWRFTGGDWRSAPVPIVRQVGDDAQLAFDLRSINPFRAQHCPEGEVYPSQPFMVSADVELVFAVNGRELRPAPGASFRGTFTDHASDPFRASTCP